MTTRALKQHSDNTFLASLTCFSGGELLCLICCNSGPRNKKKNPFPTRKDRKESRKILMPPNSVISGGKKERAVRHSRMQLATRILWLLFSLTPLQTYYNTCIFKSYLATHGEGACVTLEELCSKEQNSC